MRIATSEARNSAWLTFGWGSFGLVILAFICSILTNDAAVGKTFFFLPLMSQMVAGHQVISLQQPFHFYCRRVFRLGLGLGCGFGPPHARACRPAHPHPGHHLL